MKKVSSEIHLYDTSRIEHKSIRSDKIRTTNINILLNRVRLTKKNEFKKKIIYLSLLMLVVGFAGIFSLF